ncbi:MAG TPA: hypothetical protein VIV61_11990 [Candidatus Ozemobacteraceae bacterium]
MATSAVMRSLAFFKARLTSESVTLLGGGRSNPATNQAATGTDRLSVSAFAGLRQTIDAFRRNTEGVGQLDVTFSMPQDRLYSEIGDRKAGRDFDLMLRLLARDDEDYQRLRERFDKLMELASGSFGNKTAVSSTSSAETTVVTGDSETPAKPSGEAADRDEQFRRDLEIAEAFVARVEQRQVEVKVQITRVDQRFEVQGIDMRQADPLVLDLEGDGLDLAKAGEAAVFDVNADGTLDRTGWVRGDDALLVYDRNGNGRIDDGSELFGDQNGAAHGFAELANYDENRDNRIDRNDSVFKALQLYRDLNGNGKIDDGELSKLSDHGIVSLNLRFMRERAMINGNTLLMKGSFQRADGTTGRMDDVLFGFRDNR